MAEFLTFSLTSIFAFSLVMVRITGLSIVSPVFGGEQIPIQIRVLLALSIAFVIFPSLALQITVLPRTPIEYFILVLKELAIGLLIGFLATAIFSGFQLGGRYMSIHMGLAMARILDPFTNVQNTVMGQMLGLVVLTVFLIMNGHHLILRALYTSFVKIPPMTIAFNTGIFEQAIKTFNIVIVTSLKIAMPTMAALFAINLIFGFVSRLVPRMNVFILSLPAKIGVGVIIIMVALPAVLLLFTNVIEDVFRDIFIIINMF